MYLKMFIGEEEQESIIEESLKREKSV